MDFVTFWKIGSILLTGCFGILGLFKEFKAKKTGKITSWGLVSLVGILVSMCLGAAAQVKEWADQEKTKANTAEQTLRLLHNTDEAVQEIKRVLSPLEKPQIQVILITRCEGQFRKFCKELKSDGVVSGRALKNFPANRLEFDLAFFRDEEDAENYIQQGAEHGSRLSPDLVISTEASVDQDDSLRIAKAHDVDELWFVIGSKAITSVSGNNRIVSTRDLAGSTMLVTGYWKLFKSPYFPPPQFIDIRLKWFHIRVASGEPVEVMLDNIEERTASDDYYGRPYIVFKYKFPKPTKNDR